MDEDNEDMLNSIRPCVGMEFDSPEEAYDFYNYFVRKARFSIRKYATGKSQCNNEIIARSYCCSLQVFRNATRSKPIEQRQRKRSDTRIGCKAVMSIRRNEKKNWVVTRVIEEHNHNLATLSKRHKLRSSKKVPKEQEQMLGNKQLAGVKVNLMLRYMGVEAKGIRNIGYTERDARNILGKVRRHELQLGDVEVLLEFFEHQQMDNPSFFYSIQMDLEGQTKNFFWADAWSRMDYHYFGDVVCFDPTYGTNRYGMPFSPIVGVNHHYQTTIFGGALLYNECMESFEWVIKAWMRAMNGKQPKVILTYQESAIGGVIEKVLPGTRHRFWDDFVKCLYGYETVETFELGWNGMIGRHIMKIFVVVDVLNLPEKYVLKRWTKDAKSGSVTTKDGEEMVDDCHASVTIRFSQLCREAINIATKGASSVKAFKVAMKGFYNLLKKVEATFKNVEISPIKQIGSAPSEKFSQTKSRIRMRKVKPLKDPPIMKHKGRPGRQKSWTDNNGKKQTRTNPGQAKDVKKLASQQSSSLGANDLSHGSMNINLNDPSKTRTEAPLQIKEVGISKINREEIHILRKLSMYPLRCEAYVLADKQRTYKQPKMHLDFFPS
ncbi:hypothetical protein IFM89_033206 [Coptis chinensis]|uniref:Protein FAR1-RELATED SEQUENCE n=1 Tax=Coptis chinensis TaxID=261450 RepID=A0A835J1U2_9MAGN|nr:hypothetical protein IFM89_033206 [Coptis chinensis]